MCSWFCSFSGRALLRFPVSFYLMLCFHFDFLCLDLLYTEQGLNIRDTFQEFRVGKHFQFKAQMIRIYLFSLFYHYVLTYIFPHIFQLRVSWSQGTRNILSDGYHRLVSTLVTFYVSISTSGKVNISPKQRKRLGPHIYPSPGWTSTRYLL